MRLLVATLWPVRRILPSGHGLITITFLALLVGLELAGRSATSDLHDGLAALVLISAVALVAVRHRRQPLPWVSWLGRRGLRIVGRLDRFRYDHGIDLRGAPPIPRRLPPIVWPVAVAAIAWAGLAAAAWLAFPGGWRDVGTYSSYVLYLVGLVLLWSGLLACALAGLYVPVLLLEPRLRGSIRSPDRKGVELLLLAGYALSVAAIAWLIPTIVVLGLCLAMALALFITAARAGQPEEPAILWRTSSGTPLASVPLRRLVAGALGVVAVVVFDLLLTACGGRLLSPPDPSDAMPVTALLGTTAAWMVPGLALAAALRLWSGRTADPARRTPMTVHLKSDLSAAARQLAKAAILERGWLLRTGQAPQPSDVRIELVEQSQSAATEFEAAWPLKMGLADFENLNVIDRLVRRDEIQIRRFAFRGLTSLFKKAAAERETKGGGYWFAPHWWFITNLDREEPHRGKADRPNPPRPVGPPFHRLFQPRVRQHLHQILRGVEIDMIFIEDGVSYKNFQKVLKALFELYDVHGGTRKADDHVFRGVPKVRVMVHEYSPGKPFKVGTYREPKFDDLSRARVLHVFRDNGGHEEPVEAPFDTSWEPSPALGMW